MTLAHLDPAVQIRVIDLAAKWVEDTRDAVPSQAGSATLITRRTERFDQAYKAIAKSVKEG